VRDYTDRLRQVQCKVGAEVCQAGLGRREFKTLVAKKDEELPPGKSHYRPFARPAFATDFTCPRSALLRHVDFRVARDSAGTQTGQTGIVSCDRLVSTTIYPIRGLPITSCTRQALAVH